MVTARQDQRGSQSTEDRDGRREILEGLREKNASGSTSDGWTEEGLEVVVKGFASPGVCRSGFV